MSKQYDELMKEYFRSNVEFKKTQFDTLQAKWENTHHPENPVFAQRVFWIAFCTKEGNLSVGFKLDLRRPPYWILHKQIDPKKFRSEIFEIWKKQ
jgi:hypothetical protein